MMILKHIFGPSIPMSEARTFRFVNQPMLLAYAGAFALVAAFLHPHAFLRTAPLLEQVAYWTIGLPIFIWAYALIHLGIFRISLKLCIQTIPETLIMFLTVLFMTLPTIGIFWLFGIQTGGIMEIALFFVFCFALFEIAAFGYLAFADRALFPEVYAAPDAEPDVSGTYDIFLRGTPLPLAQVEMIRSVDNGFEAYGMGETHTGKRRFGLVIAELPVDLGFQINRSIWVSRKLAENRQKDGRNVYVTLSNGKRLPVARSRQGEFENWTRMLQRKTSRKKA